VRQGASLRLRGRVRVARRVAAVACAIGLALAFAAPAMGIGDPDLVRDINPGPDDSSIGWPAAFDDRLYFSADDGDHGVELWSSDGTEAGTDLIEDIVLGPGSSFPLGMTGALGELMFRADDGVHGGEPWASDGTPAGTALVTDVAPGSDGSGPVGLAVGDSRAYFQADDGTTGNELWVYEGPGTEARLVEDLNPGGDPGVQGRMLAVGDTVYFGGDDGMGVKLWKSDGTAAGTEPDSDDVFSDLTPHVWQDGKLFFSAVTGPAGSEPWVYDSSDSETTMLKDIVPGPSWGLPLFVSAVGIDGAVLFTVDDDEPGISLWGTDGTPDGTTPVEDGVGVVGSLTAMGGVAYFAGGDGTSGAELWRSDGTAAGTRIVADIDEGLDASLPEELTAIDGKLFFSANDGEHGVEPWVSDGTESGTRIVADVVNGPDGSFPSQIAEAGGRVFFTADTPAEGRELWSFELDVLPVAVGDAATVTEDAAPTAIPVLANDTDVDGGAPKSVASVTQPANGQVAIAAGGSGLTYVPDPGYCTAGGATDDFAYELSPGSDVTVVRVTVTCADDAPLAVDDSATVAEDAPATAIPVLANDTDVDGGPRSVASVSQPANGEVAITGGGTGLTYRPDAGYCNGGSSTDDFTYALSPGGDTARVAIAVTCGPPPPGGGDERAGIAVAARTAKVERGVARLRLRCRGEGACKGRAVLAVTRRAGKRPVRVVLGAKRFSIPAGKAKTLRIRLNRSGRSRLAKAPSGRLRVKLRGTGVKPRTVVLKAG